MIWPLADVPADQRPPKTAALLPEGGYVCSREYMLYRLCERTGWAIEYLMGLPKARLARLLRFERIRQAEEEVHNGRGRQV